MLDICRNLRLPLLGFRPAVANFAREVRSAAWQEGFAEGVDALSRAEVEAEVERLEHAVKENSCYTEIGRRALRHGGIGLAGGVVGGLPADASSLAEVSAAAPVGGVGGPLVKTLLAKRQRSRELEDSQGFFYYAAGRALGGRQAGRQTPRRARPHPRPSSQLDPCGGRVRRGTRPSPGPPPITNPHIHASV